MSGDMLCMRACTDLLLRPSRSGMRESRDLEPDLGQACHGCQRRQLQRQGLKGLLLLRLSSATRQCIHVKNCSPHKAQSSTAGYKSAAVPSHAQPSRLISR